MLASLNKTNLHLIALQLILLWFVGSNSASSQPAYQVALYVSLHPRAPPIHYCNGVIVHNRLVLTPATCTYYPKSYVTDMPVRIEPSMISVVSGVSIAHNFLNNFNVIEMHIAPTFDMKTLANNLAILRLDTSLPLGQRDDVKWIIMDDYETDKSGSYLAGFPSLNADPSIVLLENIKILDNDQCAPSIPSGDICGRYPFAFGPDCELPADFPTFNSDYGTGLILQSHVVAIFSHTVLTNPTQNCHDHPLKAIFTELGPHLDWIYDIISKEDMVASNENGIIHSAPYQQSGNSAIKFTADTTESTTAATPKSTVLNTTTTTEATSPSSSIDVDALPSTSSSRSHMIMNMKCAITLSSFILLLSVDI